MAPHNSRKKQVKSRRSRSPSVPKEEVPRTEESCANIVLYYLSKLKGSLFHTSGHSNEGSNYYDREISPNPTPKDSTRRDHSEDSRYKQKAREIVIAALQYGCANDIIERVGDYFIVVKKTKEQKESTRKPSPEPHYDRHASSKKHSKTHRRRRSYDDDDYDYEDDDDRCTPPRRKRSHRSR